MGDTGDSTYDEDFFAGRTEQIKERIDKILRFIFLDKPVNQIDQQYFDDYVIGKYRRKKGLRN